MEMHASTLEDNNNALKQEKQEKDTVQKGTARAPGSNRALLTMVTTVCLISLAVLLLTLLMLFGKIGDGCGCSLYEGNKYIGFSRLVACYNIYRQRNTFKRILRLNID